MAVVLAVMILGFLSMESAAAARILKSDERIVPQTFFGSPPGFTATYSAPGMMGGGIGIGSSSSSPICSYPGVTCTPIQNFFPSVPVSPGGGSSGSTGNGITPSVPQSPRGGSTGNPIIPSVPQSPRGGSTGNPITPSVPQSPHGGSTGNASP